MSSYIYAQTIKFLGKGSFADWYAKAKPLGVQERSDCLFSHTSMAQAHKKCAESGETATPPETQVEFHFIAYLHYGGRLLEFGLILKFFVQIIKKSNFLKKTSWLGQFLLIFSLCILKLETEMRS